MTPNEIGKACLAIRRKVGLSQRRVADALKISAVHLCNIEHGNSRPSMDLIDAYNDLFGVDPYILAWVLYGHVGGLPVSVQNAAFDLTAAWHEEYAAFLVD